MKYYFLLIIALALSTVSFSQILPPDPDTIWLKSGEVTVCEITENKTANIKFYEIDDPSKTVKKMPRNYATKVVENRWGTRDLPRNDLGAIEISEVVQAEGASKNELFNRAKVWIANAYGKSKAVTEIEDKEQGLIIIEGKLLCSESRKYIDFTGARIDHSIKIQFKDGRYRYSLYNLEVESPMALAGGRTQIRTFEELYREKPKKWELNLRDYVVPNLGLFLEAFKIKMKEPIKDDGW